MAATSAAARAHAASPGRPRAVPAVFVASADEVDVELGKIPTTSTIAADDATTMEESSSREEPPDNRFLQLPDRAAAARTWFNGAGPSMQPTGRGAAPRSASEGGARSQARRGGSVPPRAPNDDLQRAAGARGGSVPPSTRRSLSAGPPRAPGDSAALHAASPSRGAGSPSRSHGGLSHFSSPWSRSLGVVSVGTVAGWTAHAGYHVLAFFAYWFGAARFGAGGGGEFDPTDVQRMINNLSRHMRFSFSRPRPRGRRLRERLRAQRERQQRVAEEARRRDLEHEENMRQIRNAMEQEQGDASARRPSVASNLSAQMHVERALHAASRAADAIQATIEAPVEGECVEQTVNDNLRQFWPWFSICQILICFGLWLGYALQTNVYTLRASHALFDEAIVAESLADVGTPYECQIACSSRGDACAAVAFREGLHPECRLLSEQPRDLVSVPRCQVQRSWNWILYEKQPRSIGNLLVTMGGLETAYPGAASLQSGSYCQDGYATSVFWRLLGYQFTHGGLFHVGGNCLQVLFFGVPLEGFHGTGLTALMHTVGVVGGGMAWLVLDPYTKVYGASGGCYALLGMQLADLVLNWRQKKFRFPMLLMLVVLVAIETAGYASAIQGAMTTTAHAVHLGGLISGFIIGMLLTYNIEKTRRERALQVVALLAGLGFVCFALAHWFGNPFPGIRSLLTVGEGPFCWIGQVCTNEDGTGCDYSRGWQCVTCDTRECVENWYKDEDVFCVALGNREVCGDRFEDVVHDCVNC